MKDTNYHIFTFPGSPVNLLFTPEKYVNQEFPIQDIVVLHFSLKSINYYLFFGSKTPQGGYDFSFQFNIGDEFVAFLMSRNVKYHSFPIAQELSTFEHKFLLEDGRTILMDTYATGQTRGTTITELGLENKKKELLNLPKAKLNLDKKNAKILLEWSGGAMEGKEPEEFTQARVAMNELVAAHSKLETRKLIIWVVLIVLVVVLYFVYS